MPGLQAINLKIALVDRQDATFAGSVREPNQGCIGKVDILIGVFAYISGKLRVAVGRDIGNVQPAVGDPGQKRALTVRIQEKAGFTNSGDSLRNSLWSPP